MREDGLVGRSVEEVVAAVADEDGPTPDRVREALDPVVEDGRVTRDAVEAAVTDTAMVVSTAETRTERAVHAFADAREAAAPVADVDTVAARLDGYAARLDAVEERSANLTDDLARPVGRLDGDEVYDLAVEVREVASHAQGVVRTADDLAFDLDEFESWLANPSRRHDEFGGDADLVAESVADLEAAADAVPDADDPAAEWADATMRVRVLDLVVRDLAAELDDLHTLADGDATVPADLDERVADLDERTDALAERLSAAAEPSYRDRFGDDVAALAEALSAFEAPVDWAAVEATLDDRRAAAFGG
ncbi:hypothetical protein [Halosegnis marinus]|uniref:Halo transducer protein n=1 Tax=Halosegnis marinus TaxID=3034023 RepID=A0ABD5ZPB6_9EURY|nr:hypothetical protein [Halosegnis sp. DT85]